MTQQRDEDIGKEYMGASGGFRIWLSEGKIAEKAAYLSPEVMLHCPYSALLAELHRR
jgi:hypothetical protein